MAYIPTTFYEGGQINLPCGVYVPIHLARGLDFLAFLQLFQEGNKWPGLRERTKHLCPGPHGFDV